MIITGAIFALTALGALASEVGSGSGSASGCMILPESVFNDDRIFDKGFKRFMVYKSAYPHDALVSVSDEDWAKLQAIRRLQTKILTRKSELDKLEGQGGSEAAALLTRLRENTATQERLVQELFASVRYEITCRRG